MYRISQLAKPQIKGRGFIGSGNEIIETQTYYTQPENDWVFDEDQKLSYNNPVFVELCKRRGKNFDELNTGWVPQHKIGEEAEEPDEEIEEEEDEFNEDVDLDDIRRHEDQSKISKDSKDNNEDEPVTFKFGGKKSNDSKSAEDKTGEDKSVEVESPDLKIEDLENMFGPSVNSDTEDKSDINSSSVSVSDILQSTKSTLESVTNIEPTVSNRDRISAALDKLDKNDTENNVVKPRIKLNIDKSETTQSKKSIKLNIKTKNE